MRESRTYGSVRGACDETHVPTATCARQSWCDPAGESPAQVKGSVLLGSECCVATGDSGCEAYTAIAWGVGLSLVRSDIAGAESFHSLEGNMCGTAMRGADALPGSKATSRAKGSHRNLGGLVSGRRRRVMCPESGGPHREGEEPWPMYGHEKSDSVIVAAKPANKAAHPAVEQSTLGPAAAELGEPRTEAEGNADQQSTCRAQNRISVSHALERIRQFAVIHPRWEPYAGKPHVRFCAGAVR